jgi:hypothetical protein
MIFSIFSLMTIKFVDKKYFLFFYPITLTIIYNLIFIFNLGIDEGQILFLADDSGFSIKYLLINGQTIPDILNSFMPLEGIFDGGIFCPNDTAYFYILWILLPILYYFGLSWITNKIINMNKSNLKKNIEHNITSYKYFETQGFNWYYKFNEP